MNNGYINNNNYPNNNYGNNYSYNNTNNLNNNLSNNLSNNYNSYNTNNINNNNKKGGGVARVFLYLLFLGLLIAAGVIGYIALTQEPTVIVIPPEKQISKEEIIVEEKDKYEIKIDADLVKMSPDVDLNQERTAHNNPDIIGRLEVPDLFNVLVVRGANNSDYLSIDVDKNSDVKGAVFMDYRVGPDSNQINIYGHNSREITLDVPFRRLESFLDKTYFDSHPYIIFQHDHGKRVYKVVTINEVYNSNREHMKVNKTGIDFMDHMNAILTNNALNVRNLSYDENSRFIILQTCSHHWDDAVYLIIGEAIDYAEE